MRDQASSSASAGASGSSAPVWGSTSVSAFALRALRNCWIEGLGATAEWKQAWAHLGGVVERAHNQLLPHGSWILVGHPLTIDALSELQGSYQRQSVRATARWTPPFQPPRPYWPTSWKGAFDPIEHWTNDTIVRALKLNASDDELKAADEYGTADSVGRRAGWAPELAAVRAWQAWAGLLAKPDDHHRDLALDALSAASKLHGEALETCPEHHHDRRALLNRPYWKMARLMEHRLRQDQGEPPPADDEWTDWCGRLGILRGPHTKRGLIYDECWRNARLLEAWQTGSPATLTEALGGLIDDTAGRYPTTLHQQIAYTGGLVAWKQGDLVRARIFFKHAIARVEPNEPASMRTAREADRLRRWIDLQFEPSIEDGDPVSLASVVGAEAARPEPGAPSPADHVLETLIAVEAAHRRGHRPDYQALIAAARMTPPAGSLHGRWHLGLRRYAVTLLTARCPLPSPELKRLATSVAS